MESIEHAREKETVCQLLTALGYRVVTEKRIGSYILDVYATKAGSPPLGIEIEVTNRKLPAKRDYLSRLGIKPVHINSYPVIRKIQDANRILFIKAVCYHHLGEKPGWMSRKLGVSVNKLRSWTTGGIVPDFIGREEGRKIRSSILSGTQKSAFELIERHTIGRPRDEDFTIELIGNQTIYTVK